MSNELKYIGPLLGHWRLIGSYDTTSYFAPSATSAPGNLVSGCNISVAITAEESTDILVIAQGYVSNGYTGWANFVAGLYRDSTSLNVSTASACNSTTNSGTAISVYNPLALVYIDKALAPGTYQYQLYAYKQGGGSYAPRLNDYHFSIHARKA